MVRTWYTLRTLTAVVGVCIVLALLSMILFFPTLFTINSRYMLAQEQIAQLEKSGAVVSPVDIASFTGRTSALVQKLASSVPTPPTAYVTIARNAAPKGVQLFGFTQQPGDVPMLIVSGTADTREQLQGYITTLEQTGGVKMVDSPIGNYINSKNIEFTISIVFTTT